MKKIYLMALVVLLFSCKKTGSLTQGNNGKDTTRPTPTAVGTVTGDAVSKVIGAGGGSISSTDGMAELIIPANALSGNTTISLQPITNNCPGAGLAAYRFGPNGLHFSQPVTLKIHYTADELQSTIAALMGIAYQDDSTGIWYRLKDFTNDSTEMALTTSIKHFTDYAEFYLLHINPDAETLKVKESKDLTVDIVYSDDNDDVELPPLPGSATPDISVAPLIVYKTNQCVWAINGGLTDNDYGHFTSDQGRLTITYQAPDKAPKTGNPVAVSATIDMGGMTFHGKKYTKTTLVSNLKIVDQLSFHITLSLHSILGESPTVAQRVDYSDGVSFDVDVKYNPDLGYDSSDIYNIVNQPPTISPSSFTYNGYSYVLQPYPYGEMNVASGNQLTIFATKPIVKITLVHKDAAFPAWLITNPQGQQAVYGGGILGTAGVPVVFNFDYSDQPQTVELFPEIPGRLVATISPTQ